MANPNPRPPFSFSHTADIVLTLLAIFISYGSAAIALYYQLSIWWQLAAGAASVMSFNLFPHVHIVLLLCQIILITAVLPLRLLYKVQTKLIIRFEPATIFCTIGIITLFLLFLDRYASLDFLARHPLDVPNLWQSFAFNMGNGVVLLIIELISYYGNAEWELITGLLLLLAGDVCFHVYIHLLISWIQQGQRVQPTEEVPSAPPSGDDGNI